MAVDSYARNLAAAALSGGGQGKDYNQLQNKPMVNGVELSGDKTAEDLGLVSETEGYYIIKEEIGYNFTNEASSNRGYFTLKKPLIDKILEVRNDAVEKGYKRIVVKIIDEINTQYSSLPTIEFSLLSLNIINGTLEGYAVNPVSTWPGFGGSQANRCFSGTLMIYCAEQDGKAVPSSVTYNWSRITLTDIQTLKLYLSKNNTTSYTPTSNYHPATKKYVDDTISNVSGNLEELETEEKSNLVSAINEVKNSGGGNNLTYITIEDVVAMETTEVQDFFRKWFADYKENKITPICVNTRVRDDAWTPHNFILERIHNIDTFKRLCLVMVSGGKKDDTLNYFYYKLIVTISYDSNNEFISAGFGSSNGYAAIVAEKNIQTLDNTNSQQSVLATNNTAFYTPTSDYHPATKKYVDDTVSSVSGNLEELETENKDNLVNAINEILSGGGSGSSGLTEMKLKDGDDYVCFNDPEYEPNKLYVVLPNINVGYRDSDGVAKAMPYANQYVNSNVTTATRILRFTKTTTFLDNPFGTKLIIFSFNSTNAIYVDNLTCQRLDYWMPDNSLPRGTLLGAGNAESHLNSKYLSRANTSSYTPTGDYNPATKKYVDDNKVDPNSLVNNGFDYEKVIGKVLINYSVENISAEGFELNTEEFYESTCKGINNGYSLCKVTFNNEEELTFNIDYISNGESAYDYGIFSNIDQELSNNNTDDGNTGSTKVKLNCKNAGSANIKQLEYTIPSGEHFIYIKYRKDGSGNTGNDSLQFKIPAYAQQYETAKGHMAVTEYVDEKTGLLDNLETTDKSNLVNAINELKNSGGDKDVYIIQDDNFSYSSVSVSIGSTAKTEINSIVNNNLGKWLTFIVIGTNNTYSSLIFSLKINEPKTSASSNSLCWSFMYQNINSASYITPLSFRVYYSQNPTSKTINISSISITQTAESKLADRQYVNNKTGLLENLETETKTDLVSAINEVKNSAGGSSLFEPLPDVVEGEIYDIMAHNLQSNTMYEIPRGIEIGYSDEQGVLHKNSGYINDATYINSFRAFSIFDINFKASSGVNYASFITTFGNPGNVYGAGLSVSKVDGVGSTNRGILNSLPQPTRYISFANVISSLPTTYQSFDTKVLSGNCGYRIKQELDKRLATDNTTEYNPIANSYNPATTKYVDDAIASAITTTLEGEY